MLNKFVITNIFSKEWQLKDVKNDGKTKVTNVVLQQLAWCKTLTQHR